MPDSSPRQLLADRMCRAGGTVLGRADQRATPCPTLHAGLGAPPPRLGHVHTSRSLHRRCRARSCAWEDSDFMRKKNLREDRLAPALAAFYATHINPLARSRGVHTLQGPEGRPSTSDSVKRARNSAGWAANAALLPPSGMQTAGGGGGPEQQVRSRSGPCGRAALSPARPQAPSHPPRNLCTAAGRRGGAEPAARGPTRAGRLPAAMRAPGLGAGAHCGGGAGGGGAGVPRPGRGDAAAPAQVRRRAALRQPGHQQPARGPDGPALQGAAVLGGGR